MDLSSAGRRAYGRLAIATSMLMGGSGSALADISGAAFTDYDGDGARQVTEAGVAGVTVTAYDDLGNQFATTTAPDGTYSIPVPDGTDLRVEFTNLPVNLAAGAVGPGSLTSTRFLTSPAAGVDAGFQSAGCTIARGVLSCFENGSSGGNAGPAVVSFDYGIAGRPASRPSGDAGVADPVKDAQIDEVGAVWGLAYDIETDRAFAAAFLKRHVGLGAQGLGGLYEIDLSTSPGSLSSSRNLHGVVPANGGPAIDLGSVIRDDSITGPCLVAGDCILPNANNVQNIDLDAFGKVGTIGLGDTDLSEDGQTLWVVNLFQRALVSVDVSTDLSGAVNQFLLTDLGVPACPGAGNSFRPFGVEFHDGVGYLTGVCDAMATQTIADLEAVVLTFDPADPAASGLTEIFRFALEFEREAAGGGGGGGARPGEWQPWAQVWADTGLPTSGLGNSAYAQPILSDLEVTDEGDLVLGFMDRWGHQAGFQNRIAVSATAQNFNAETAGDVVKVCDNGGTLILEGDEAGLCVVNDPGGVSPGTRTDDGPSRLDGTVVAGEFFFEDQFGDAGTGHLELAGGGIAFLPGSREVATIVYDPLGREKGPGSGNGAWFTAGVHWYDLADGSYRRAFEVVPSVATVNFGKATGLGDVELQCLGFVEIGNRVWHDINGNGVQDPFEPPRAGVVVNLLASDGTPLASATTDVDGEYYFRADDAPNLTGGAAEGQVTGGLQAGETYIVQIDPVSFAAGQPLDGLDITQQASAGATDLRDSDGSRVSGSVVDGTVHAVVTVSEPGTNDHDVDFGFRDYLDAVNQACVAHDYLILTDDLVRIGGPARVMEPSAGVSANVASRNQVSLGGNRVRVPKGRPSLTTGVEVLGLNVDLQRYVKSSIVRYDQSNSGTFTETGKGRKGPALLDPGFDVTSLPALPNVPPVVPGFVDVVVAPGAVQVLTPGVYRNLIVNSVSGANRGTVVLDGEGTYTFNRVELGEYSRLLVSSSRVTVEVQDYMHVGEYAHFNPDAATDFVVLVAGADGAYGGANPNSPGIGAEPAVFHYRGDGRFNACHVTAQNGSLNLRGHGRHTSKWFGRGFQQVGRLSMKLYHPETGCGCP